MNSKKEEKNPNPRLTQILVVPIHLFYYAAQIPTQTALKTETF